MFLKSLSEYQQRAEIERSPFSERWAGSSLEEDILITVKQLEEARSIAQIAAEMLPRTTALDFKEAIPNCYVVATIVELKGQEAEASELACSPTRSTRRQRRSSRSPGWVSCGPSTLAKNR
jgi:hypothetical protein